MPRYPRVEDGKRDAKRSGKNGTTVNSGPAGRRATARLLAVCAVLLGLFLMHGTPATAAGGCHGAMPTMPSPVPVGHSAAAMTTAHVPAGQQPGPAVQAANATAMPGALCVSTPARERIPLPVPGLLAVAALAVLTAGTSARLREVGGRTRRRGPPDGGRDLLLKVCIART